MDYFFNILSLLILLSCFSLIASKYTKSYINTLRIQSLLIAITTGIMSLETSNIVEKINIIFVCAVIFVIKVIYLPYLLNKTAVKVKYKIQKDFFLNIPLLVLISGLVVIFTYFTLANVVSLQEKGLMTYAVNSISVVLIGLLFMISRKKAIGQIVGLLVMENGLFITALFVTHGMPLIVDLGIVVDLVTAVIVMRIMVVNISEKFGTIDINKLKKLRG